MFLLRRIALLARVCFVFAVFLVCAPANAQLVTTTYGPFAVNCSSGTELCNNFFSQSVTTTSHLQVEYIAAPTHCSNIRAHILVDGVQKAVTAFLTPGQASGFFDVGPVSAGSHAVALQGEGIIGGCNVGVLQNWGGTMVVMTDLQAVPAVSAPTLVLLGGLVLAVGMALRRYQRPRA
jgi:hypothetical protein